MSALIAGAVEPGFEPVADAFVRAFDGHERMGAALSIRVGGRAVIDLHGGVRDVRTAEPWTPETASVIFSCTKGLAALLAARLVQEGRLDYDAPVAHYWPEFAAAGKEGVLVRHVLAHRSGLSAPDVDLSTEDILDWSTVTSALAAQRPLWEPGEAYAYHAITQGWLVGEVVRRIVGTSVGDYFRDAVTAPLGVDAWIGLPPEQEHRVAHLTVGPTLRGLVDRQTAERDPSQIDWLDRAMTLGAALPATLVEDTEGFNDPRLHAAQIPAAGGIATASALATIWSATVVDEGGMRLLDDATLDRALEVQTSGAPHFAAPPPWPRWGMGFQLDSEARRYLTGASFGHDGAGGQVSFADPVHGVGFAFLTNVMEAEDPRATRIIDALRACLS
ncbi:serine hydrolase [Yonghaparkia sp. Soil809]|uniref:serine hydrolase domain-containing protein n=1 Tax=Yonghaparkia sp. Soil809 TaxID=1736417 RepID=UPI0006F69BAE|nr:serine hydrolase domain-containing protein [Yonghaparkia sp. Soil809]KRF32827.1 carboxylesterase [Yonghaparkia sp. Soil809]